MSNGFKNPIAPKGNSKSMKSPWNFNSPKRDDSTSCYANAGSHYGVGFKQPVGHTGNPKQRVDTMPFGKVNTMEVSQVPKRNLPVEVEE